MVPAYGASFQLRERMLDPFTISEVHINVPKSPSNALGIENVIKANLERLLLLTSSRDSAVQLKVMYDILETLSSPENRLTCKLKVELVSSQQTMRILIKDKKGDPLFHATVLGSREKNPGHPPKP
jgi:hypothetical protein